MITVDVRWHDDPERVVGVRVGERVVVPLPELDSADLEACRIRRHVEAPPAPTFRKQDAPGLFELPPPPAPRPSLAPAAFVTWLVDHLPKHGAVEALDAKHGAFQRVYGAARAGLITARAIVNPGSNHETTWAVLLHNLEHVVRRCAMPADVAFALVRPTVPTVSDDAVREAIRAAAESGVSLPGGVAREIVEAFDAERAAEAQAREKEEAARRREVEPIEVDLAEAGLCVFTCGERNPIGARAAYRVGGLPVSDVSALPVAFRQNSGDVSIVMARVQATGTAMMTRRERSEAERRPLPDELVARLREVRRREPGLEQRYSAQDFKAADARSVEGRAALLSFRERAASLAHALATATAYSELAAYTHQALTTLVVAYGGAVSLPNAIDSVQEALRAYARSATRGSVYRYDVHGRRVEDAADEHSWPAGLMHPESVPGAVLAELSRGSCWHWGELARPPSPGIVRRVRAWLDPGAFERLIGEAVGDAAEVRWQAIADRLFAEGLIASTKPSIQDNRRIGAALERLGFEQTEGKDERGVRCRVWRRSAAA